MPYLTERWLKMKTALLAFVQPLPPSQDKTKVLDWINNVVGPNQSEVLLEGALGELNDAADELADAAFPDSKKNLRLTQGAASRPLSGAVTRITHRANPGKLSQYMNKTADAVTAGQEFVKQLKGGGDPASYSPFVERILLCLRRLAGTYPDKVTQPVDSLIESMSRYLVAHPAKFISGKRKVITDPSSFWPSSYISSTSTTGGGILKDCRPEKEKSPKNKPKKQAAGKTPAKKKTARKATRR